MARPFTWLVSTPILAAGVFAGHELGYRLVFPSAHDRAHALEHSGHGYFAHAPYLVAALILTVAVGVGLCVREAMLGRRRGRPSWAILLLPPPVFLLLEATERLHAGELALSTLVAPAVLAGLALQVPFALAALLVARLLGSVAEAAGVALRRPTRRLARPRRSAHVPPCAEARRIRTVALAYGERGPPAF